MKESYFDQEKADADDTALSICIAQDYVPKTCLLGGSIVMTLKMSALDPCRDCPCDRSNCGGR